MYKFQLSILFFLICILFENTSLAQVQKKELISEDELAQETVYPVLDHFIAVKNRIVNTDGKFELGVFGGQNLTEPLFLSTKSGVNINYHFNEAHAVNVNYNILSTPVSAYSKQIYDLYPSHINFDRAPRPTSFWLLNHEYKLFYGKISFTKNAITNIGIHATWGVGQTNYEHKSFPTFGAGVAQKIYFNSKLSFRMDLKMISHTGPSPYLPEKLKEKYSDNLTLDQPAPKVEDFEEKMLFATHLDLGLSYIF